MTSKRARSSVLSLLSTHDHPDSVTDFLEDVREFAHLGFEDLSHRAVMSRKIILLFCDVEMHRLMWVSKH